MSVLRTAYPNDSFTAATDGGPVTITSAGTDVPDQYVASVRAQAAAQGVTLLDGGPVTTPAAPLAQRVATLEQTVGGLLVPLVEQAQLIVGPVWPTAKSGQTVPVSMAGATAAKNLTLEPGGPGSRLAVRLDVAGSYPLNLVGSDTDVVPVVQLTTSGSIVFLEGFTGGWRVVGRTGDQTGAVSWTQIADRPTIPTQLSQLGGQVTDQQIPDAIARDAEVATALGGYATSGHTHSGYAASGHTHSQYAPADTPAVEIRLTADYTGLAGNTWFAMRGQMGTFTGSDPYSMFTQPGGSGQPYQLVIPAGWGGRWDFLWQAAADGNSYSLLLLAGLLNSPDTISGTEFTGYIAFRNHPAGMGICTGSAKLAAGDKIGLAMHCVQSGTWNLRTVLSGSFRTKCVLAYRGPN